MADFDEDDSPILDIDKEGGTTVEEDKKVEEHLSLQPGFDGRKVWLVKVSSSNPAAYTSVCADSKCALESRFPSSYRSDGTSRRKLEFTSPQ